MEYATLNNGVKMPMAGIGTFLLTPDEAEASCVSALQNGYRLIDTANAYVNEKAVGRAMKKSGLQREEIFLETKLWPSFYEQPDAVEKTLARLDTPYIDLLLIHQPAGNYVAGYRQMEKAYKEGKVRAIGLSNFNQSQIEEILSLCEVKPTVLQTELHPYHQEPALKAFLKENGIRTHVLGKISDGSDEIPNALRQGHIAYVINTRDPGSSGRDGIKIRRIATEHNVTLFTALDTIRVLLDVLEETTLTISTIDA